VLRGFLARPAQTLPVPAFDGFICLNFMEHWPKPVSSLRAIARNLVPGGLGLVEVPNFDMILKEGQYSEFISDHLSYFTLDTLGFTLRQAGFEVLDAHPVWHDYILSATVRKRQPADSPHSRRSRQKSTANCVPSSTASRRAAWRSGAPAIRRWRLRWPSFQQR